MPTGSRRNTKNLTAAKMPPKGTKRTAEPCPIQSGAKEERGRQNGGERTAERGREDGEAVSKSDLDAINKVNNGFFISQKLPKIN